MARPADPQRRRDLLDALIDDFAARGIGDRSLREVAKAVGTSHRMLLPHFGSRNDLLVAIVEEVERRQRALLGDLPPDPAAAVAAMWADVRRKEMRGFEKLFFECYARGVAGEQPFARMVPGAVSSWLAEDAVRPHEPAAVRLGLAVVRGLLLDLVATDDLAGVDAAASRFMEICAGITAPIIVYEDPGCRFYRSAADAVAGGIGTGDRVFDSTGRRLQVADPGTPAGLVVSSQDGASELATILRGWLGYMDAIRWSVAEWTLPWLVTASVEHLGYSG